MARRKAAHSTLKAWRPQAVSLRTTMSSRMLPDVTWGAFRR